MSGRPGGLLATLAGRLSTRLFPKPIASADALAGFVGQRAAWVAQTTLFGYLKTRMGTKFPEYFGDEGFAGLIRTASVRLFASCAADLAVHSAAVAGADGRLAPDEMAALARHCLAVALREALSDADAPIVPPDCEQAFAVRVMGTDWGAAAIGEAAFAGSIADLPRFAPVSDAFRRLDRPIVRNSIRFAWRDVRTQLGRRLDQAAVCADWRALPAG